MKTESSLHSSLRRPLQLEELDGLTRCPPSLRAAKASKLRTQLRGATYWASKFDVVSVLGGEGEEGRGSGLGVYGHTGCINALDWSKPDGTTLASGSDDTRYPVKVLDKHLERWLTRTITRVCIWKLGQEPDETFADNADVVQRYPGLGIGLSAVIHTGHRANIFSVKFAPRATNVIFTASGDHEARVFDLNQAASAAQTFSLPRPAGGAKREWSEYSKTSGVCTRVLKCHRGRVKRIATEGVSDAVFLTCSEDGTVRQHDLRIGHVCKRDCPPPLCSYREKGMGLYSLTTSVLRPELFVVAGTSPYAYLHDRRMVPRTMMEQWGVPVSPTELTQCVRRFGPARPPLVPEPPSEGSGDEDEDAPNTRSHAQRMYRLRQRRARMRSSDENHVTAAKLSNVNGRELLLTYSGGPVCLYDIFDEPESEQRKEQITAPQTSQSKSKRRADQSHGEEDRAEPAPATRKAMASEGLEEATEEPNQTAPARKPLVLPQPRVTREALQSASDFVTSSLESNPNLTQEHGTEDSSYTPVYTAIGQEGREPSQQNADPSRQEALRASLRRSSSSSDPPDAEARQSSTSSPAPRHFEIRVGDDGNLEMELDNDREADTSREEEPDLNTEGYQALLQNLAASQSHSHGGDGAHQEDEEDEESDEPEYFEDDDISTSDDPESAEEEDNASRAVNREIPLVRPQKLYKGHRNVDTVKDVNFGGMDNLVVSGSDDGNVFIYDKETTDLIAIIKGDESVVNVMQYHPSLPIMAVSGIDNSAKILAPTTLGSPEGKVYLQRKFSRLASKEDIMRKNQDASWTSERLAMPPSILINLLNRAAAAGGEDGDDDDEGGPGRRRRIPLSALLQLAGEEDSDQDCVVM